MARPCTIPSATIEGGLDVWRVEYINCGRICPLSAKSGHMQRSKMRRYSITSSARASTDDGISNPSAFAVLRLITKSYLVGCCTGRSAGFDVAGRAAVLVEEIQPICDETAGHSVKAGTVNCRQPVLRRQRDDQVAMRRGSRTAGHNDAIVGPLRECCEGAL